MTNSRSSEFDVLRTIIILNAAIIHFHYKFGLSLFALPVGFIQAHILNVGTFFFFTSGYMACKIYAPRFQKNKIQVSIKLIKKGAEIFIVYILYVLLMHLANGRDIPEDLYSLIYEHGFFTKVLFPFSILFIISPILIRICLYRKALIYFLLLSSLVSAAMLGNFIPTSVVNSQLVGVTLGIGERAVFYSFYSVIVTWLLGYLVASVENEKNKLTENSTSLERRVVYISLFILVAHILQVVAFDSYRDIIDMPVIAPIVGSIMAVIFLSFTRQLLSISSAATILTQERFLLIGKNSLVFYISSNAILGLLRLPTETNLLLKLQMFGCLVITSYYISKWSFYSKAYKQAFETAD